MTTILLLLTFLFPVNHGTKPSLVEIRNMVQKAAESKSANKELQSKLALFADNDALIKGFRATSTMIEAKHMFNPLARWNKFKQGKALLEEAIKADGANYELRYLRFAIQTNIPAVLGYDAHIAADKKLLIDKFPQLTDQDLKTRVLNYMLACKACTPEELTKLKQWKKK